MLNRRTLLAGALVPVALGQTGKHPMPRMGSAGALERLMAGNGRFVTHMQKYPDQSLQRRAAVAQEQHPFAMVLACADSRVPPEILFDQGLGDLFVIRVAGNIVDDAVLGSIEYGALHLGVRLLVVLGHESCGAVGAAVSAKEKGAEVEGHIGTLVKAILPAVEASAGEAGDRLDNAVRANVRRVVKELQTSQPELAPKVEGGSLRVVGAHYGLKTGKVQLLG